MTLRMNDLSSPRGARKKRKMVGRGSGSGHGKTSCRGSKGQLSRSGKGRRPGFEGGQIPLIRRIPKRGFTNRFREEYQIVNLDVLDRCAANAVVGPAELAKLGMIASADRPVKILGNGTLKKRLTVKAHKFSKTALEAIKAQGGTGEVLTA